MVETRILTEAACAISKLFSQSNIALVFIGGWVSVLEGCQRETKDVDCFVACTKEVALTVLETSGAIPISQARTDYLGVFWPTSHKIVLVELFIGTFPNLHKFTNKTLNCGSRTMNVILGPQETVTIYVVDIPSLFRGKLHSAMSRKKSTDIQDLCFITTTYTGLFRAYQFMLRQD